MGLAGPIWLTKCVGVNKGVDLLYPFYASDSSGRDFPRVRCKKPTPENSHLPAGVSIPLSAPPLRRPGSRLGPTGHRSRC